MFPYRELFLAVIISLASITLADVLVQPGYHQSDSNPRYSQPVPQYQINSLSEQYRTEQLPKQESSWYLPRVQNVQTVYPYYESNYEDKARSNLVSYPHRSLYNHHYHYSPRPKPHYAKIGGHGYVRPSVFVGHPQPLIVHHRYRRSLESDPTTTESSKSAIVAHDNDVAAKSSLTDVKHPTANDSLLPEHEPTDTNDKRVENRQTKNDHVMMPRLFDLYPENIYSGRYSEYRPENAKIMQQPLPSNPSMPSFKSSEAIKTIVPTARQEYCCDEDQRLLTNRPSIRWEPPLEEESSDTDDDFDNDNRNNDEDPRLLTNRPPGRWQSYLQSLDTDDDYNTDNKYRTASYRQGDSQIFYTMLLHNAIKNLPHPYDYNFESKQGKENQQQAVHQELEKHLQEILNGMGTIHTAEQKQLLDHVTMYIPRNVQPSANLEQPSFTEARTTEQKKKVLPWPTLTSNQSPENLESSPTGASETTAVLEACTVRDGSCGQGTPIETRYRNNEKLSGINENVDMPYSDRTGISLPFHFPHYPGNYDYSKVISDWDEFSDNAEFYNRNSNSAYRINPSKIRIIPNYDDKIGIIPNYDDKIRIIPNYDDKIRIIPNYDDKYYTNINDPNNLAPKMPQTQSQSLDTHNYSPENIQAVSSDLKYEDNTYPSDTQLYDMFSSPVYY